MDGRRNPLVAAEGIPYLLGSAAAVVAVWHFFGIAYALLPLAVGIYFYLTFRDPFRSIPAVPLGVVSPVDGHVIDIGLTRDSPAGGEAQKIILRVDSLGTYTARSPVEGKIMDLSGEDVAGRSRMGTGGLWVRTDENDDVVLQFTGYRFGLAPRAFLRYGERVGQGQRCAYLRLARMAEVIVPLASRILVTPGQRVEAGTDVLARLPHS